MTKEEIIQANEKARQAKRYFLFVDGELVSEGNTRSYMVKKYIKTCQENREKMVYLWDDWNSCEI